MPITATVNDSGILILTMSEDCNVSGGPLAAEFNFLDDGIPIPMDAVEDLGGGVFSLTLLVPPSAETNLTLSYVHGAGDWRTNSTGDLVADFTAFPVEPI